MYKTMYLLDFNNELQEKYQSDLWLVANDNMQDAICDYTCATSDFGWDYNMLCQLGLLLDSFRPTDKKARLKAITLIVTLKKEMQSLQDSLAFFQVEKVIDELKKFVKKIKYLNPNQEYRQPLTK